MHRKVTSKNDKLLERNDREKKRNITLLSQAAKAHTTQHARADSQEWFLDRLIWVQTVCKGYQRKTLLADGWGQKWALKKSFLKAKWERRQRSGNDTIKYHTWPRIPHGKVIKRLIRDCTCAHSRNKIYCCKKGSPKIVDQNRRSKKTTA